jgi:hypothetical protein
MNIERSIGMLENWQKFWSILILLIFQKLLRRLRLRVKIVDSQPRTILVNSLRKLISVLEQKELLKIEN